MKERSENFYEAIVKGSPIGYAYHKIILNENSEPCDYEFIEVNPTFEKLTGLRARDIIGKRVTEVLPGILDSFHDWLSVYGEVALTGKTVEFDQFSEPQNCWYRVKAECPQKYYFITRFLDISKETRQAADLEEFFKVNLDLVCVANTDGYFLQVNREWENVTGYTAEEMVGSCYLDYVHPDDLEATRATITTLVQQKPLFDFVNRFCCKDGTYRHIEWRAQAKGKQIYAAARDITEKVEESKCMERLISMSEDFLQFSFKQVDYQKIVDTMLVLSGAKYVVLNLYDRSGDIYRTVAVSGVQQDIRKATKLIGIDLVGKNWPYDPVKENKIQNSMLTVFPHLSQLSGKVIPEKAINAACKLFSVGETVLAKIVKDRVLGEFTMLMPAGKRFVRESFVNIYTRQVGLLISRLQSEEKIHKLLDENEKIFDGTQGALYLLQVLENNQFRYIKNNHAFYERTGVRLDGKMPCDVYEKEEAKRACCNYMKCIAGKKPISYEETLQIRAEERVWAVTLTPVYEDGKPIYIVGYSEDITEKKQAENELKENLQLNDKLIGLLTHSHASLKSLLDDALGVALHFTASSAGFISLYDDKSKEFEFHAWTSQPQDMCYRQNQNLLMHSGQTSFWGEVVRSGKPLIINDFSSYQYFDIIKNTEHIPLSRCLAVPVFDRNKLVAVIGVANKTLDYSDNDILRLTLLMNNVWSVAERTNSEESLKNEKELLKTTLFSIGDGILATDRAGRVMLLNEAAEQFTGWTQDEAYGKPFGDVFCLEQHPEKAEPENHLSSNSTTLCDVLISKNGTKRPIAKSTAPIMDDDGLVRGVVLAFRDITLEKQHQEEIEFLSYHDQLTGLYNRRFFEEELRRLNTKSNLPLTLVMADVNGLKLTNDAFGHAMGDKLLISSAEMLRSVCREDDIVARLGGDEFVMLLPRTDTVKAEQMVLELKSLCEGENVGSVELSLSFGWHTKYIETDEITLTLKKAEDNMYRSKLFESPSMRGKTIQAIVQTLYETHQREQKHSERVSHFSENMGHALGLSEKELGELKTTALLHDIGKIAIESSILNKAEALTDLERAEIKRHSEIGYRILSSVNDLADIAEYVLAHHERWDGKGYPKGLAGEDIPLWSRIISIADSFDAMTAERAYRQPVSEEQAIEELRRNAGIQYDAKLVRIFVEKVLHRVQ